VQREKLSLPAARIAAISADGQAGIAVQTRIKNLQSALWKLLMAHSLVVEVPRLAVPLFDQILWERTHFKCLTFGFPRRITYAVRKR
jgi:hypothetical protein